jgi:hypothetical protein
MSFGRKWGRLKHSTYALAEWVKEIQKRIEGDMNLEINRICKCGHSDEVHGADPDADPNCEDELVESGQFYSC